MKTNFFERFSRRHIGLNENDTNQMLEFIGVNSLEQLIDETVPEQIRTRSLLNVPEPLSEYEYLKLINEYGSMNKIYTSYIGQGYYGTITPSPILRNIFENPGWYTQYTPYQAEIAQGRLEALLNFQTMVSDLTGLPIANASLLDEGTAASEAMLMFFAMKNKRKVEKDEFIVLGKVFQQTLDVLIARAEPMGIKVIHQEDQSFEPTERTFGILLQYPDAQGRVQMNKEIVSKAKEKEIFIAVAADLLALSLITPPGEWGADVVVGNTQRFGVPMGFGGPHAAFFACTDFFKRNIPGRIIGVSVDVDNNFALRMALQTREQHIKREKATSNICTAQALLAIIASMYSVYHGPQGIKRISESVHNKASIFNSYLKKIGLNQDNPIFYDTLWLTLSQEESQVLRSIAESKHINLFYSSTGVGISFSESITWEDLLALASVFNEWKGKEEKIDSSLLEESIIPENLLRKTPYLQHEVFNSFHTESELMRYIRRLENKDLSLVHSMISLGSCTMKLNAATELIPVTNPAFSQIHPFAPKDQVKGYLKMISELEQYLNEITGFTATSLQPNSGAQGEYTGLLAIRAYHMDRGNNHRNIALIPASAHGTNPASAVMAGFSVVVVGTSDNGNIDLEDLKNKVEQHKDNLGALMVTYPSTHGVFEAEIKEICQLIHDNGGLVYMDGANMNAQVGLTSPGAIGADVCHLNLHKTFAIPHGGGGPGMGPICVNDKLAPYLPKHSYYETGGDKGIKAVSSAPYGSASILLISYAYIRMLGAQGLVDSTKVAILNANYIKARLEDKYPILYTGEKGRAAHEMIIDLRPFKEICSAEDLAKRLMDYGFHAPTLSFPVAGTLMIEPTESESKNELDRFCDAMLSIREEIDEIARGEYPLDNNVLFNAPHTALLVMDDEWNRPYSRQKAAYPLPYLKSYFKFWPSVRRVNSAYGDRNLVCTCPPMEMYMD
jgi:glycine dehydrogenase